MFAGSFNQCLLNMGNTGLFARKNVQVMVAEATGVKNKLQRSLTAKNVVFMGVGGIIGAGIFVLTGNAAATSAGPAIVISFIISGIACAFAALCYAELAAMIPVSGSAYTFAYATLGEFLAWIIGWDLILEYLFGASTVAVGWSGYLVSLLKDLNIHLPAAFTSAPFLFSPSTGWYSSGAVINLPAAIICLACATILFVGIRESAKFANAVVVIKLTVLALFVIIGCYYVTGANWTPFIPSNTGNFGEFGWSGIFRGAGLIFFAYIGFDCVSTLAQETKNPQRDMPIGIIGSLIVVTIVYIIVSAVLTGVVNYKELGVPDPIAVAVNAFGPALSWLRPLINLGAVIGLTSVILMLLLGQTRVFYSMANDGLLPRSFALVHRRYRTPYLPTIITGAAAFIIAGCAPINILNELVSIGTLLAFVIVCVGVVVLRVLDPKTPRPFRAPAIAIVGPLGALGAISQMVPLPLETWIRLLIWMAIGVVFYFSYSYSHSRLRRSRAREAAKNS